MVSSVSSRVSNDGVDGGMGKQRSASTACMAAAHSMKVRIKYKEVQTFSDFKRTFNQKIK